MRQRTFQTIACLLAAFICGAGTAEADEGMWPVHLIENSIALRMQALGLEIPPDSIYSGEHSSLSDAVVSLDFGCTGSIISDKGLLITNHHCAYSDIAALSTPEHNWLEDGFWAMSSSEEIPIKGKNAYFLRKVLDVTEEIEQLRENEEKAGRGHGNRRIFHLIEKKYSEQTGLEASVGTMWKGERQYLYLYEVHSDLRLVAAPPVSIGAFGGDTDNWEWPQHKGDFAIYRIYTAPDGSPAEYSPDNVPLNPRRVLRISSRGINDGDFTMILGYPGRTDRYSSSYSVIRNVLTEAPAMCRMQGRRMEIMNRWMQSDPAVRLTYADTYFSTSNAQEMYQGRTDAVRRYGIVDIKRAEEARLWAWIDADSSRKARWGSLRERMDSLYAATEALDMQRVYYREAWVRSSKYYLISVRIRNILSAVRKSCKDADTVDFTRHEQAVRTAGKYFAAMTPKAEKEMLAYSLGEFLDHVSPEYWGTALTSYAPLYRKDPSGFTDSLVNASFLRDSCAFIDFVSSPRSVSDIMSDPLMRLYSSADFQSLNRRIRSCEERLGCRGGIYALEKEFTAALYSMREDEGRSQYPDANSTMRLTFGTAGPMTPRDAVRYSGSSTSRGILEKYRPDIYEYGLKPDFKALIESEEPFTVNFLSNNDITGGNSGSPVLDSHGNLIGLAFDGNKESLCSDVYFHPDYCRTVSVDIRYVLWILDRYAGMDRLLDEILR